MRERERNNVGQEKRVLSELFALFFFLSLRKREWVRVYEWKFFFESLQFSLAKAAVKINVQNLQKFKDFFKMIYLKFKIFKHYF